MTCGSRRLIAASACFWAGCAIGSGLPTGSAGAWAIAATLSLILAARLERRSPIPRHAASMRTLTRLAALTFVAGCLGATARQEPPGADASLVRLSGLLVSHEETASATMLTVADRRVGPVRVTLPKSGHPSLDRLPSQAVLGAKVSLLARRREDDPRARGEAPATVSVDAPPNALTALRTAFARARRAFQARARRRLVDSRPGAGGGTVLALVTGERSDLPRSFVQALRRSGLAHLFVVSGLHVGWLVLAVTLFVATAHGPLHPRRRFIGIVAASAAAVLLPSSAPVRRAVLSLVVVHLAVLASRRTTPLNSLAVAVLTLLALDPGCARSWSFGLTVVATGAILLAASGASPASRLRIALAPGLATWPLIVIMSGRVSPWGAAATLPAVPLVLVAAATGWAAVLAPEVLRGFVSSAASAAVSSGQLLRGYVETVAALPGSGQVAAPCGLAWAIGHEIVLAFWLLSTRAGIRRVANALVIGMWLWPLRPVLDEFADPPRVTLFDVGQGQALLLRDGPASVLVDAGDDRIPGQTRRLVDRIVAEGVRRLSLLAITHPDRDHSGGAEEIQFALRAERLAVSAASVDHPALSPVIRQARRRAVPVVPLDAGRSLRAGPISLTVWHPPAGAAEAGNGSSLVLEANLRGLTVWIAGDAGCAEELTILAAGRPPRGAALIAGHHGSRDATCSELLAAVEPSHVLASCGQRNRYGHPHREFVERIARSGARLWTTAGRGDLQIVRHAGRLIVIQSIP